MGSPVPSTGANRPARVIGAQTALSDPNRYPTKVLASNTMLPKMRRRPSGRRHQQDGESGKPCRRRYPYATPRIAWPSAVVVCPCSAGWWPTGGVQPVLEPRRDRRLNEVSESFWGTTRLGACGPASTVGRCWVRPAPRSSHSSHPTPTAMMNDGGRNRPGDSGRGWRRAWSRSTGLPGCGPGCR